MYKLYTIRVNSGEFINYCYLGIDSETKQAFVIDPAWSIDEILDILNREGGNIRGIFLTHSHYDHLNKAVELAEISNSPIFISQVEYEYYRLSIPYVCLLRNNQDIKLGRTVIRSYLTPGHTKGSMCYKVENAIFTGDTLFIEGCGICNTKGGSTIKMFESLNFLKTIILDNDYIYPGHAYVAQVGQKATYMYDHNVYMCIDDVNTFTLFRNRENQNNIFAFI